MIIIEQEKEGCKKDSFNGFKWKLRDELNL